MKIYKLRVIEITKYYLLVETVSKEHGYVHISEVSHFYVNGLKAKFEIDDVIYGEYIGDFKGKRNFSLKSGLSPIKKKTYVETGSGFLPLRYLLKKMEVKNDKS